jgi:hypothetical protein
MHKNKAKRAGASIEHDVLEDDEDGLGVEGRLFRKTPRNTPRAVLGVLEKTSAVISSFGNPKDVEELLENGGFQDADAVKNLQSLCETISDQLRSSTTADQSTIPSTINLYDKHLCLEALPINSFAYVQLRFSKVSLSILGERFLGGFSSRAQNSRSCSRCLGPNLQKIIPGFLIVRCGIKKLSGGVTSTTTFSETMSLMSPPEKNQETHMPLIQSPDLCYGSLATCWRSSQEL